MGIAVYIGVDQSPAITDDWSRDTLNALHPTMDYKSQNRFKQIKHYLDIAAPDIPLVTPLGRRCWYAKVTAKLDRFHCSYDSHQVPYSRAKNTIISSSDGLRSYCDAPWRIKPTHKPFRLLYAWGIINAGICSCDDSDTMPKVMDIRAPDVTRSSEVAAGQFCSAGCGYLPAHMGKMAGCWLCRWRNRGSDNSQNLSITVCSCASCVLSLCLREERNYFRDFHKR